MNDQINFYSLLGLEPAASPDDIKKAYRKLVFRYHPDRNPDDRDAVGKFKQILEAYQVLSDEDKRARYNEANGYANQAKSESDEASNNGFQFSYEFKAKVEPEPRCPQCSIVGVEHIISRKGGAGTGRGKRFITSPFMVVFCSQCGHIYGVTGGQS